VIHYVIFFVFLTSSHQFNLQALIFPYRRHSDGNGLSHRGFDRQRFRADDLNQRNIYPLIAGSSRGWVESLSHG
jgi:hypothetical protein